MRHLKRLDKPQILIDKEAKWTEKFIQSESNRPSNKQYGHKEVKEKLANISFNKCFYSEVRFADLSEAQVDHYIEVAEDKNKAFEWENLYLSHKDCNQGKISNLILPNVECLNPFVDSDEEIEKHIGFEDEQILGITEKGAKTIQKYNLNKPIYDILRGKELRKFNDVCRKIALQNENKQNYLDFFKSLANPDRPFSLMFRLLLKKYELI